MARPLKSESSLSRLCSMGTVEYLTRSTCSFQVHSVPSGWPLLFLLFFLLFSDSITLRDPLIDPSAVFNISNLSRIFEGQSLPACATLSNVLQRKYNTRDITRCTRWSDRYLAPTALCFLNTIRLRNTVNSHFALISAQFACVLDISRN